MLLLFFLFEELFIHDFVDFFVHDLVKFSLFHVVEVLHFVEIFGEVPEVTRKIEPSPQSVFTTAVISAVNL